MEKRRVFSAFGHFFLSLHDKLFWRKKPKEKVQSIFHLLPGSKYLTMNTVYITASPNSRLSSKSPCCLKWQVILKKCLIINTPLPHDKAQFGDTHREELYGIDIRHRTCALQPFLSERKKKWHKFFLKGIIPNQSNHAV